MLSLSKAEKSYIQAGLLATPPARADGRALLDARTVALETGIAPLANGSARLSIGRNPRGGGGTEVVAASKLEVESIEDDSDARDGGRIICTVSCSPSAYPHLTSQALEDFQSDLTSLLHQTLAHPTLHPRNLGILKNKKSWLLHLDVLVLSDAGNVLDALFMAARAALWDTRVPRTRGVEYKAPTRKADEVLPSGFETRVIQKATDFELPDYWDEGEVLDGRTPGALPRCHGPRGGRLTPAPPPRLLLSPSAPTVMQAMRMLGPGELTSAQLKELIKVGEQYAREMFAALDAKLREEDVRRHQKARERFEQHR
ncbi:putative 3' exoribonuclease family, domain 1 [Lyophyllum shimeji]|uniref:Ribosomal RNA-processing protein 42 n=1 Tax=Lyophyllum shimeji TaxID=47721 RepID=A0A9P3PRG8_LYOSH|nr:putative 3' exoribonuclease family, domain 1 [Lyophyllum shimeji]